nr:uncharacterized protein LOC111511520 isoform X2 [Leptinotarsa decemlineata]
MVMAKDETGVGLLHKAIYYDLEDIYKWLIQKFPFMVSMRDSEGRTAYHYTSMCKDPKSVQKLLTNAGADPSGLDQYQHSAKYYVDHKHELELPSSQRSVTNSRRSTAKKDSLNFKKSNIRIWIHQRNLTNLQQVMWEGHGGKLLVEHSNNPKIKKFLEAVPHIMGLIKDIHTDVQNDDLESLKNHLSPPVPPIVLSGKDSNGLTPLHKAVGLDKKKIAEFILQEYPECINSCDNDGRTPLHYAALVKDDGTMTKFLIQHGADESALDNKQKTAAYYKTRNSEMDSKLLNVVPECPRSAKESFATNFDWTMLTSSAASMNGLRNGLKKMGKNLLNGTDDNENKESSENIEMKGTEEENHEGGIHNETNENEHGEEKEEDKLIVSSNENENSHEKEEENVLESQRETNDLSGRTEDENEDENLTDNIANKISQDAREENTTTPEEMNDNNNDGEEDNREDEKIDNRIEAENDADEIPRSPKKSRPNSQINSVTRPNTQEDVKSRPTSKNLEKSRPNSQHISQSRSISESAGKSRPTSLTNPSTRPGSEELEANGSGPIVDDEKVIEGIVHEEDEAMNNEGLNGTIAADTDDDIKSLVESGNMELLASLVLNGEGERLVGKTSENPELQSFLENVPLYMSKIRRIHEAARNGSLRDLQAALDRRKFAIAKDVISPNGASPLHVSVIFGNTSIVRYLAGRFPETVQVLDENDRTPLHYAAVLGDNGHYYNLLVHLGADVRLEDKFGHKPDYYRKNQEEFSHRSLLKEFGVEDTKEFFEDKVPNDIASARKDLDDEDMISVLERCYNVLHGRRSSTVSSSSAVTLSSSTYCNSFLGKHIRRHIFDTVKFRVTKLDHNLYDIIWPSVKKLPKEVGFRDALEQDYPLGIVAPDIYAYTVFREFLDPIIKDYNYIDINQELLHPVTKFMEGDRYLVSEIDLDPQRKYVLSGTLNTTRNLADFELPKSLNHGQLELVERIITSVLLGKEVAKALYPLTSELEIEEKGSGTYYTMNEVLEDPSEAKLLLSNNGLLIPLWNIPDSERLHGSHWPYGRGVFISNGANLAVWVNVLDHLRIVTCSDKNHPGAIGQIFSRISRLMVVLDQNMKFIFDEKLGYLSSRPSAVGNTLQFKLTMRLPYLIKEPDNLKHLCAVRGLTHSRSTNTTDVVKLGNQQCLGITEQQCFEDITTAVANIIQLEKDLAMSNSLHIAAIFLNIFKKKKLAQSA